MRTERFKTILQMVEDNTFQVVERHRIGDTEQLEVKILAAIFFQLTQEEVLDGINGYMGCKQCVTEVRWDEPVVSEYAILHITMKDVNYVRPKSR